MPTLRSVWFQTDSIISIASLKRNHIPTSYSLPIIDKTSLKISMA